MTNEPENCLVCFRPLPPTEGGRPLTYCGMLCKREAEQACRRIRRRVAKLEDERAFYLRLLETPSKNEVVATAVGPLTARQALVNIASAIQHEIERLHALTAEHRADADST